jgi:TfoX/Sxy family transcriptional regulator of competence genes
MPYDAQIEERIQTIITDWENTAHKKMFGGVCHLLGGNMFCGVYKAYLILRLGEENGSQALRQPHVKPFDVTGRPMKGWVMVATDGFKTDTELADWLGKAREFAGTLPPK